jgi:hypothetical protein
MKDLMFPSFQNLADPTLSSRSPSPKIWSFSTRLPNDDILLGIVRLNPQLGWFPPQPAELRINSEAGSNQSTLSVSDLVCEGSRLSTLVHLKLEVCQSQVYAQFGKVLMQFYPGYESTSVSYSAPTLGDLEYPKPSR